jgi:ferredoxin
MPHSGFVSREAISSWLDNLMNQATLIAPHWVDDVLLYRQLSSSEDIVWEFTRPVLSIKEFFLPPTERLLTIEKIGAQIKLAETFSTTKQVLFGVRPCEARGIRLLDALFLEDAPVDPYYAERRKNTAIIGLACEQPGDTCFCTSVGGAPDDPRDVDVMLYTLDDGYSMEVVTEKGRGLVEQMGVEPETTQAGGSTKKGSSFDVRHSSFVDLPEISKWPTFFAAPYWEEMAERCLSCRICAYVCPTCRCFDVRDEVASDGSIERLRCWDSCAGAAYRRIAGGHNPRSTKGERLRNRFFCKFYYYPRQYGINSAACTGCGRCIDYCPVGIDVTEVVNHLSNLSELVMGESGER